MNLVANRYKIIDFDGIININKIYKAEDTYKNKKVLLKLIKHTKYIHIDFLTDLIDEITAFRDIKSPFICPIIDVGICNIDNNPCYYIISSFFDGVTLEYFVKNNKIKNSDIVNILTKVLKGLEVTHLNNIYHGSLSPRNILINENFDIKILDFCIVKANKGEHLKCIDLKYLAPEQLSINYTDVQSDFYSLGIILFELMFDKLPYEISENEIDMLKYMDKRIIWSDFELICENKKLLNVCKKLLSRKEKYNDIKEIIIDTVDVMYEKVKIKDNIKEEIKEINDNEYDTKKEGLKKRIYALIAVFIIICTILASFTMF